METEVNNQEDIQNIIITSGDKTLIKKLEWLKKTHRISGEVISFPEIIQLLGQEKVAFVASVTISLLEYMLGTGKSVQIVLIGANEPILFQKTRHELYRVIKKLNKPVSFSFKGFKVEFNEKGELESARELYFE